MSIPSDKEYQTNELIRFLNSKSSFFDNLADFEEWIKNTNVLEQIEWIENGSYGCGACLALQNAYNHLSKHTNNNARIGNVVLQAFYGMQFTKWNKLSKDVQSILNNAIEQWFKQDKDFVIKSIL
jgi:hypothetical protein